MDMKKILIALLMAMLAIAPLQAGSNVVTHGDTIEVVEGTDTVRILGVNALSKSITNMLNDTVVDVEDYATGEQSELDTESPFNSSTAKEISNQWSKAVAFITMHVMIGIVFIVLLSLLFRYLHRRRKYMMVEKAIENNYPLPEYIFGGVRETVRTVYVGTPLAQQPPVPQQPTPPPFPGDAAGIAANPQPADAGMEQPAALGQPAAVPPAVGRINWMALKGGFTLTAVGIGACLFFLILGAEAPAGACSILILLGLGKMWIAYQDQKSIVESINQMKH